MSKGKYIKMAVWVTIKTLKKYCHSRGSGDPECFCLLMCQKKYMSFWRTPESRKKELQESYCDRMDSGYRISK